MVSNNFNTITIKALKLKIGDFIVLNNSIHKIVDYIIFPDYADMADPVPTDDTLSIEEALQGISAGFICFVMENIKTRKEVYAYCAPDESMKLVVDKKVKLLF